MLPHTARSSGEYNDLRVEYWTEEFDAVVVGFAGESDAPHVPDIPGLADLANKFPERVYHVREYRTPDALAGKVRFSERLLIRTTSAWLIDSLIL